MSIFDAINIATTGLSTYTQGLDLISNNISNLNTIGFKQYTSIFSELPANGDQDSGLGVSNGASYQIFTNGTQQTTGNDMDTAITGSGFFVLQKGNQQYLTRDGQFQTDPQGNIVFNGSGQNNPGTGAQVMGWQNNQLVPLTLSSHQTSPAHNTTDIVFSGDIDFQTKTNVVVNASDSSTNNSSVVPIYDTSGVEHNLTITLIPPASSSTATTITSNITVWGLTITDATSKSTLYQGTLELNDAGDSTGTSGNATPGAPVPASSKITFNYQPNINSKNQAITLDFSKLAVTNTSTNSSVSVQSQTGYSVGSLQSLAYDAQGNLTATYSNSQTAVIGRLALATTQRPELLQAVNGNMYTFTSNSGVSFGAANTRGSGSITGGALEGSNVDLTTEFSDLIIVQRGYQAASEVVTTTNDMLGVLFSIKGQH